jgi:serine/threonine protein kinase
MSPAQASGKLHQLGSASDIYSLGSTLYYLLTANSPFGRRDQGAILQQVQRGEFPPPLQVKRSISPALEAICLKAMAPRPESCYASARMLADDLAHWLTAEPVGAWPEPLWARCGRWVRGRGALVSAAAGLLAAAVVALVVGIAHITYGVDPT